MLSEFDGADDAGMLPEGVTKEDVQGKGFTDKSVFARISVVAAGPAANFLLAFLCALACGIPGGLYAGSHCRSRAGKPCL